MSSAGMKSSSLAVRATKCCRSCGHAFPETEFIGDGGETCLGCWLGSSNGMDAEVRDRALRELAERVRVARQLGNGRAVAYPVGFDYRLMRLLDSLRHYVVKVRITLVKGHYRWPDGEVLEGHLRRWSYEDGSDVSPLTRDDALGLFRNIDDQQPLHTIHEQNNFYNMDQIVKIECIDPLLLGDGDPATVWEAPPERFAEDAAQRDQSLVRERKLAKLFLLHAGLIVVVWVALLIPVIWTWRGSFWVKCGWIANFVVFGFLSAMTIVPWFADYLEPDLSVLKRRPSEN